MNARRGRRFGACQIILAAGLLLSAAGQLPALGAHGKSHHHPTRQEAMPAESADESSPEQASQEQASQESAPAEEQSSDDGARTRQPASHEGVSLFSVLGQVLGFGLLIVLFGALPMSAMVLFCSMIWHSQKALNGGKKPSIG